MAAVYIMKQETSAKRAYAKLSLAETAEIVEDGLTIGHAALYALIVNAANFKRGFFLGGVAQAIAWTGTTRKTAAKMLDDLARKGWIKAIDCRKERKKVWALKWVKTTHVESFKQGTITHLNREELPMLPGDKEKKEDKKRREAKEARKLAPAGGFSPLGNLKADHEDTVHEDTGQKELGSVMLTSMPVSLPREPVKPKALRVDATDQERVAWNQCMILYSGEKERYDKAWQLRRRQHIEEQARKQA